MKILCFILSLALAVGLFVSCGRQAPMSGDFGLLEPSGTPFSEPSGNPSVIDQSPAADDPDLPEDYYAETVIPEDDRPETVVISITEGGESTTVATPKAPDSGKKTSAETTATTGGKTASSTDSKAAPQPGGQKTSQSGGKSAAPTESVPVDRNADPEAAQTAALDPIITPANPEDETDEDEIPCEVTFVPAPPASEPAKESSKEEEKEMDALVDKVLKTARVTGTKGDYRLTWTQPEIPEKYHLRVEFSAYAKGTEENGNCCLEYYCSDEGYLTDPSGYDPSAGAKTHKIEPSILTGRKLYIVVRVYRSDFSGSVSINSACMDFDGSVDSDFPGLFNFS